jgi:hypothetical protein
MYSGITKDTLGFEGDVPSADLPVSFRQLKLHYRLRREPILTTLTIHYRRFAYSIP